MFTRNLDSIVDVAVEISPLAAPRQTFDQLLIQGSTVLDTGPITETERVRVYESTAEMLEDGFANDDPEYLAAQLYFSQSPAPDRVWIGMRNASESGIDAVDVNAAGTGYSLGDILTVVKAGASGGTLRVTELGESGAVAEVEIVTRGTGYEIGTGLATTVSPSGGTGCTIDVDAVGAETILEALQKARLASNNWYTCMDVDAVTEDHKLVAAWIETATPLSIYGLTTQDPDTITSAGTDIFTWLKDRLYSRTIGQYSTDSPYAIAAIMGYAMGANTQLANSAYTLKFKNEIGIQTEALSSTQITNLEGKNGNVYLNYADYYNIFEQGVMANGAFFDEKINLDMLVNKLQLNVMDLLYKMPKVPQTEAGVTQIVNAVASACEEMRVVGFLGPGTWTGRDVLNLKSGDTMPAGYIVQAAKIADQSQADREARKSPSIYAAIKEAGAVHSVLIGVYVNR